MRRRLVVLAMVVAVAGAPRGAVAQEGRAPDSRSLNLAAYSDLLWSDLRGQKVAVLTELMALTEAEDAAFWPIYRAYDAGLAALHEERAANVGEYTAGFGLLTDSQADALGTKALDINRRRTALLESCYGRIKTAVSPRVALRFLQVEHQLLLLADLQIASSLPVVK